MRWLVCAAMLASVPAAADDGELAPTSVKAKLRGTTVELIARVPVKSIELGSETRLLEVPDGAIVTGATVEHGGKSQRMRLDTADQIERDFDAVLSREPGRHRMSAVRITTASSSSVMIELATANLGEIVVELSLEMPTCFFRDARYAAVPERWAQRLALAKVPAPPEGCGEGGDWIAFPTRDLAKSKSRIGVIAGRLPLGERDIARVEIDLARELADVPADLHTAIVIDGSRSLTADEIEAQRAVVASYVAQVPPQSRVQVIAYARDAKALLPSWMPAVTAAAQIDREIRSLAPRNGSNLDLAIDEAASWLSRAKGTRRLIVISDERLPARMDDALIAGFADRLPEKTLAHVVALWIGTQGLQRVDDLELSPLATATEGMSTSASLDDNGKLDARMLVRPTGIDNIAIAGEGWAPSSSPIEGERIDNGTSLTWFGIGSPVAGPISISGFIWGHRVTRIVHPDPTRGRSIARELSAAGAFLDSDLHELVSRAAFAVNESWSLMTTWGGSGGFADLGGGGFGTAGFCCDTGGSSDIGHGTSTGGGIHLDFKKQLAPTVARCGAQGVALSIVIETTLEEIVDVHVTGPDDAMRACIEQAVWATSLQIPNAPSHATTTTKF
jgi:hypothetical protein